MRRNGFGGFVHTATTTTATNTNTGTRTRTGVGTGTGDRNRTRDRIWTGTGTGTEVGKGEERRWEHQFAGHEGGAVLLAQRTERVLVSKGLESVGAGYINANKMQRSLYMWLGQHRQITKIKVRAKEHQHLSVKFIYMQTLVRHAIARKSVFKNAKKVRFLRAIRLLLDYNQQIQIALQMESLGHNFHAQQQLRGAVGRWWYRTQIKSRAMRRRKAGYSFYCSRRESLALWLLQANLAGSSGREIYHYHPSGGHAYDYENDYENNDYGYSTAAAAEMNHSYIISSSRHYGTSSRGDRGDIDSKDNRGNRGSEDEFPHPDTAHRAVRQVVRRGGESGQRHGQRHGHALVEKAMVNTHLYHPDTDSHYNANRNSNRINSSVRTPERGGLKPHKKQRRINYLALSLLRSSPQRNT